MLSWESLAITDLKEMATLAAARSTDPDRAAGVAADARDPVRYLVSVTLNGGAVAPADEGSRSGRFRPRLFC